VTGEFSVVVIMMEEVAKAAAADPAVSQAIANEVTSALGHLAKTAEADLEAGEAAESSAATDSLISTVAKSMISKVDTDTSISIASRGAKYCWGKVRGSLTKKNLAETFGEWLADCCVVGDSTAPLQAFSFTTCFGFA